MQDWEYILREKPSLFLSELSKLDGEEKYTLFISKKINLTYCHASSLVNEFVRMGMISKEGMGRKKILTLTKKGMRVATKINEIISEIKNGHSGE